MGESQFVKKVKSWVENIRYASEYMKEETLKKFDEDNVLPNFSFGWKEMIEVAVDEQQVSGFLLTGHDGCGKHTAADTAVSRLATGDGGSDVYEIVYLSGHDFCFSDSDIEQDNKEREKLISDGSDEMITDDIVHTHLEYLLNEFNSEENWMNLCLVVEDVADSSFSKEIYYHLGKYMCMYMAYADQLPKLFVILIEPNEYMVPSLLRRYLRTIRMCLPNEIRRKDMLKAKGLNKNFIEPVASATEGFTYTQLDSLAENIKLFEYANDMINSDVCMDMIESQKPLNTISSKEEYYAEKSMVYRKIAEFVDSLPPVLEMMHQGMVNVTAVPAQKTSIEPKKDIDFDKELSNIEKQQMEEKGRIEEECKVTPIMSLVESYIGKERMKKVNMAGQY